MWGMTHWAQNKFSRSRFRLFRLILACGVARMRGALIVPGLAGAFAANVFPCGNGSTRQIVKYWDSRVTMYLYTPGNGTDK